MGFERFGFTISLLESEIKHIEQFIEERKKKRKKLICDEKEILKDWKDALRELKNLRLAENWQKLIEKIRLM